MAFFNIPGKPEFIGSFMPLGIKKSASGFMLLEKFLIFLLEYTFLSLEALCGSVMN
ncbi:hypothetical protein SLEP1_g29470 [Rubroshorea leprosula]|uniref:Uncharacterized protein n=1 Tax=Rubroshorea leprosula TaxID=152421 RepID=A0AAV5JWY2_9ROSI|nr:hypothetical protein SLEP1_g29470 [Rubroshorea leprosula]